MRLSDSRTASQNQLSVGSLFAGIGGFDLAAERAGLTVKWQVEIDPFCRRVLEKHWPSVRRYDDVRAVCGIRFQVDGKAPLEGVDIVCGGDPCQANSNAGSVWKREHADTGAEFVRVVSEIRPRFVVRENPSRVRADAPWPWWRFRDQLATLGYQVLAFRLRSCCLGAHHRRDRMFVLGALLDSDRDGFQGIDWEGVAEEYAVGAAGVSGRYAGVNSLPTPRICRGVDGIPDRMDRLRALGNAVDPQVAEWIFRRIVEAEAMMAGPMRGSG